MIELYQWIGNIHLQLHLRLFIIINRIISKQNTYHEKEYITTNKYIWNSLHNNIAPTHIQQNHYLDTHRLYKKQDQQLPAPPLPPKIKLIKKNNDLPPPLPPKIQLFLNKEEQQDISLDDNNSFFGSSKYINICAYCKKILLEWKREWGYNVRGDRKKFDKRKESEAHTEFNSRTCI